MNDYTKYTSEELEDLLKNPESIETACEYDCDSCKNFEITMIKKALKKVQIQENL